MAKEWTYSRPKLRPSRYPVSGQLERAMELLDVVADSIATNNDLSETGKRSHFTERSKLALSSLKDREKALHTELKTVMRDRAKLRESKQPQAPSLAERQEMYELVRLARENPENQAYLFSVIGSESVDPETRRIQTAFLGITPHMFGPQGAPVAAQYQRLLRARLGVDDLGHEGDALDERESAASHELDAIRAVRVATLSAADRDVLYQTGFCPKPAKEWTREEATAFVHEHGADEYQRVLFEEATQNASDTQERIQGIQLFTAAEPTPEPAVGIAPAAA